MQRTLVVAGGLCVFAWVAHVAYSGIREELLERRFNELRAAETSGSQTTTADAQGLLGHIEIAGRDVSSPIMQGVDRKVLDVAVGHIPGTAEFHQSGNVALAGHRDKHFRGLRNVHVGDRITIATTQGDLAYEVLWTKVTTPDDIDVIAPQGEDVLTLVTCFPFHYVGSAPNRFIVRAARVSGDARETGPALIPSPPAP